MEKRIPLLLRRGISMKRSIFYLVIGLLFISFLVGAKIPKFQGDVKPYLIIGEMADNPDPAHYKFGRVNLVAFTKKGEILISGKNTRLSMYDTSGKYIKSIGKFGKRKGEYIYLTGLAVDSKGNIVVLDKGRRKVIIYDKDGKFLYEFGKRGTGLGEFEEVTGLTLDKEDNIYVSLGHMGRFYVFTEKGKLIRELGRLSLVEKKEEEREGIKHEVGYLNYVSFAAINSRNQLVVTEKYRSKVLVFDIESGKFLFEFGRSGFDEGEFVGHISGVCIGPEDTIWVVDSDGGQVLVFTRRGSFITSFGTPGIDEGEFVGPKAIAYDPYNKRIAVADERNYRVQIWNLKDLRF